MATESTWVGSRLRELREAAKLSQQELADALAVSRETVARWETDQREPNWTNVRAMAAALGTTCEAFNQQPAKQEPPKRGRPKKAEAGDQAAKTAGQDTTTGKLTGKADDPPVSAPEKAKKKATKKGGAK